MICEEFETRLHDLLDERRHPEDDAWMRSHASTCDHCFQVLQSQERLFYGLARMAAPEAPSGFSGDVLQQLRPQRRTWARGALAAALAAALLLALLPGLRTPSDDESLAGIDPGAGGRLGAVPSDAPLYLGEPKHPRIASETVDPIDAVYPESSTVADPNDLYRRWLADMAEHVQRMSSDTPGPVGELASSLRPVAHSISAAIGALRQTLPGIRSTDVDSAVEKPQAGHWRDLQHRV